MLDDGPPIPYDTSTTALFTPEQQHAELPLDADPSTLSDYALAAEFSRLAYLRLEDGEGEAARLRHALRRLGFGAPVPFHDAGTGTQGFASVRVADGLAIVAMRGTQLQAVEDWLADAEVAPQAWDGLEQARVHTGFQACTRAILPQVQAWLADAGARRSRLLVCGHSLGAAVATLLARPVGAQRLITFGSPRVGDVAFVQCLAAQPGLEITRVVDCVDLVTMIPPGLDLPFHPAVIGALGRLPELAWLGALRARIQVLLGRGLPYRHAGRVLYIRHDGTPVDQPSDLALAADRCRPEVWSLQPGHGIVPTRLLSDHAAINHVRAFWP